MAEITKEDILEVLQQFSKETLDPKFDQIGDRFEQVDQQFKQVNQRFKRIDERFEKIDQRFEQTDQRIDGLDQKVDLFKEEIIHPFHVISEDVISQVKLVAEGVANLDEKFTREITSFRRENEQAHQEIMAMIKFSGAKIHF
jgi:archaellum component FlaC